LDTLNTSVGIDKIRVYPGTMGLDMASLVSARGQSQDEICGAMMIYQRSVNPPWEDPVTMAVNAALPMLTDEERSQVKLLLVASESGLDQEKPLSTWVQRYLDLPDSCRNLEVKHACYGGTAALQLAATWVMAQSDPQAKALVIATDQSRAHFGKPYEFVMGAGSVAMLISRKPRFLALELGRSGVFTYEVSDLTRPTSRVESGHSETSLLSYLDAVDICFERYCAATLQTGGPSIDTEAKLREWLPHQVYHAPFGGITLRAHKALFRTIGAPKNAKEDFQTRVAPALRYNRRLGSTYASSVFISLLGLVDANVHRAIEGERVGIYSYGSGSCAEFYSGIFGPQARQIAQEAELNTAIEARRMLSVREYEEAERERLAFIDCGDYITSLDGHDGWYQKAYQGKRRLTFRGVQDFVRRYDWS
jgi:3-hydroxy-3-methylglutaryl CoA synthase